MVNSIVEYYSEHEGYRCGYCKRTDSNYSHGMWAHSLSVSDYERLLDRGWRRSGMYCYKPTMDSICCPMYTIRCRALDFKPSKSQKKIMKKVNKFLVDGATDNGGGEDRRMSTGSEGPGEGEGGGDRFVEAARPHTGVDLQSVLTQGAANEENKISIEPAAPANCESTASSNVESTSKTVKQGIGADKSKGPCKKAKQLRLERKMEKLRERGVDVDSLKTTNKNNKEKQLEDFLNEIPEEIRNKLEVRLVRTAPPSAEWAASAAEAHRVYAKYQMAVHGDAPHKCTEPKFCDFLVRSPLQEEYREGGPACGYGSFHQQYWLSGQLVAAGVVDILPSCISSVYFFYDPHYRNLSFGTYGALREVAFMRELHKTSPSLKYYYMGFYIHSCPKMRYKGNFAPSDLLCPETYKWFPLADCIPKLEASPYSRLNPDLDAIDEDACKDQHLNSIRLLIGSTVIPFEYYKRKSSVKFPKEELDNLMQYAMLVGAKSLDKLILVR